MYLFFLISLIKPAGFIFVHHKYSYLPHTTLLEGKALTTWLELTQDELKKLCGDKEE